MRDGQLRGREAPLVEPSDLPGRSAYGKAVTRSQTRVNSHHVEMICVHMHFVKRRASHGSVRHVRETGREIRSRYLWLKEGLYQK